MSTVNPFSASQSASSPATSSSLGSSLKSAFSMSEDKTNSVSLPDLFGSKSEQSSDQSGFPFVSVILVSVALFFMYNIYKFYTVGISGVTSFLQPIFQYFSKEEEKEKPSSEQQSQSPQQPQEQSLDSSLNTATTSVNQKTQESTVAPDDAMSSTVNGKSGFCFIGMEKGYRSCASVEESDVCMSGEIFPSKDVCINPQLRY